MNRMPLGPLMVDVEGTTLTPQDVTLLQHPAVGGVILFARNYENKQQVRALTEEIKSLRYPALLIAVDQEGGRVQRFVEEFYVLPPANDLGEIYDINPVQAERAAFNAGRLMASEVILAGVDFSFAPVLDHFNAESQVIGNRGFHSDSQALITIAKAYIEGMNTAGMAATGKHFPGHGGVLEDSHFETPVDERSMEELMQRDLQPFSVLANNLDGVMTAHVLFPQVQKELPTFSEFWLKDVLRNKLAYSGVVFSDDLTMKGAERFKQKVFLLAKECSATWTNESTETVKKKPAM